LEDGKSMAIFCSRAGIWNATCPDGGLDTETSSHDRSPPPAMLNCQALDDE